MRIDLVDVERVGGWGIVVELVGGGRVVDHFECIGGERVGNADGNLLLQPEPVWDRIP
jgi:hypothetical protein